jgi:signal transduction histidine kinase
MIRPIDRVSELRIVIHQLNNALTPILANAQLMQVMLGDQSEVAHEVQDVVEGAKRANELVGELRSVTEGLSAALEASDG